MEATSVSSTAMEIRSLQCAAPQNPAVKLALTMASELLSELSRTLLVADSAALDTMQASKLVVTVPAVSSRACSSDSCV